MLLPQALLVMTSHHSSAMAVEPPQTESYVAPAQLLAQCPCDAFLEALLLYLASKMTLVKCRRLTMLRVSGNGAAQSLRRGNVYMILNRQEMFLTWELLASRLLYSNFPMA